MGEDGQFSAGEFEQLLRLWALVPGTWPWDDPGQPKEGLGMGGPKMLAAERSGLPQGFSGERIFLRFRRLRTGEFNPWGGKIPWRRKCQPTPEFLPGESQGQWSLVGYSPKGSKEVGRTGRLSTHTVIREMQAALGGAVWDQPLPQKGQHAQDTENSR